MLGANPLIIALTGLGGSAASDDAALHAIITNRTRHGLVPLSVLDIEKEFNCGIELANKILWRCALHLAFDVDRD